MVPPFWTEEDAETAIFDGDVALDWPTTELLEPGGLLYVAFSFR